MHYRARAYAPAPGRFLQRDPLGYDAGSDLYGYADERPTVLADPFGLYSIQPPTPDDSVFSDKGYHITAVKNSVEMQKIQLEVDTAIKASNRCACGSSIIEVKLAGLPGGGHGACWEGQQGCIHASLSDFYEANEPEPYENERAAPNCPEVSCFIYSMDRIFTVTIQGTSPSGKTWSSKAGFRVTGVFDWWNPARADEDTPYLASSPCRCGAEGLRVKCPRGRRASGSSPSLDLLRDGVAAHYLRSAP